MVSVSRAVGIVSVCMACACWSFAGIAMAGETGSRSMKYTSRKQNESIAWQKELRSQLIRLLKMDDLVSGKTRVDFHAKTISSEKREKYVLKEMEIDSTPGRRMKITLALPTNGKGPFPAVVCVAGHGGTRRSPYEEPSYRRVGHVLAEKGYVTISATVKQHETYEKGRTLMGERLWDLMRCVDYLTSLEEVHPGRIGCAGLSLGGEMTMWLGATDERVGATVSAGFLTRMDQMEKNHCMCWKFPGLRDLADFADIYSLIAPRPLLCQNGLKEPPSQFPVSIAREALKEIEVIYADLKRPENVALIAHEEGHVIDLPSLLTFFEKHIGKGKNVAKQDAPAGAKKPRR